MRLENKALCGPLSSIKKKAEPGRISRQTCDVGTMAEPGRISRQTRDAGARAEPGRISRQTGKVGAVAEPFHQYYGDTVQAEVATSLLTKTSVVQSRERAFQDALHYGTT